MDRTDFIRSNTSILAPPLVPEIRLHLAEESLPIWRRSEEELGEIGLPPPFWAFAWAGGQALARYILDHPETVRGHMVLDLAAGSGLAGIAAALSGAASVSACDIDTFAVTAIGLNAKLNGVGIATSGDDVLAAPPPDVGVILAGDLFYEQELAARALAWLSEAQAGGTCVLIGDPGRTYLPKAELEPVAEYRVPVSRELEDAEIKHSLVWRIAGAPPPHHNAPRPGPAQTGPWEG